MGKHVFLIPRFASADEFIEVELASSLQLGRGVFGIDDKNVSREQATLEVDAAGNVVLRAQGVNPVVVKSNGETSKLRKGEWRLLKE